jgi:hypothetical protein
MGRSISMAGLVVNFITFYDSYSRPFCCFINTALTGKLKGVKLIFLTLWPVVVQRYLEPDNEQEDKEKPDQG